MNCSEVRQQLARFTDREASHIGSESAEVREHLESCPDCQITLRSLERWDEQISSSMNDVDVPADFAERLISKLEICPRPSIAKGRVRSLRVWIAVSCLALSLICVAAMYGVSNALTATIGPGDLGKLLVTENEPLNESQRLQKSFPRGWTSVPKLYCDRWHQVQLPDIRINVAVQPFAIDSLDNKTYFGSLIVIPKSRWRSALPTEISGAAVQYNLPYAWIAWTEQNAVYVLALDGPTQSLEELQNRLQGHHAML
jgi:hypothetical protein